MHACARGNKHEQGNCSLCLSANVSRMFAFYGEKRVQGYVGREGKRTGELSSFINSQFVSHLANASDSFIAAPFTGLHPSPIALFTRQRWRMQSTFVSIASPFPMPVNGRASDKNMLIS